VGIEGGFEGLGNGLESIDTMAGTISLGKETKGYRQVNSRKAGPSGKITGSN